MRIANKCFGMVVGFLIGIAFIQGILTNNAEPRNIEGTGETMRLIDEPPIATNSDSVAAWSLTKNTTMETEEVQPTQESEDVQISKEEAIAEPITTETVVDCKRLATPAQVSRLSNPVINEPIETEEVVSETIEMEEVVSETTSETIEMEEVVSETTSEIIETEEIINEEGNEKKSYTYTYKGVSTTLTEGDILTKTVQSHYCACTLCCGEKDVFITKGGITIRNGMEDPRIVGCNWLPMGSIILIGGIQYTVQDTGSSPRISKVGGVDVFEPAGHEACFERGLIKNAPIEIIKINN